MPRCQPQDASVDTDGSQPAHVVLRSSPTLLQQPNCSSPAEPSFSVSVRKRKHVELQAVVYDEDSECVDAPPEPRSKRCGCSVEVDEDEQRSEFVCEMCVLSSCAAEESRQPAAKARPAPNWNQLVCTPRRRGRNTCQLCETAVPSTMSTCARCWFMTMQATFQATIQLTKLHGTYSCPASTSSLVSPSCEAPSTRKTDAS
uniref:Uncharacterized protein n=1 Tax=Calcidiscus leptoporus TaxID=127549 RepID=A0A6U5DJQ6_9EUKA|mmetsp:Transcript_14692/g.33563  ORF Transcript_14692/g.33563 Transcript_14692/m.33563 type:complete len:201 (+) Transcript_14692:157-759(+)|eukprot:CAMPEP_0119374780 /NCGR_PEP_ID=MMETSP1334-20130426/32858_1 /TAXON_ID=127549 /ORGANISM="Calcidiscus leptoporus, Strain RCC1130" /LENGTH=200 /DNA_ID=CAMNT_0007392939 /DNA_START=155 /DNA_END=757 /DNA_ORIENTATION=-